ncbi:hypothetical protein QO230_22300 [Vibrio vulnificus]|uniref:hypothetical protein n=1 Tax=Vibrio vulnificus TaxID=672 RepID=UPI0024DF88B2|nr:hypothetical protein [Vibrio vulnificus]MDK2706989.1 hypothetical protein [Vibrio vulnificus]
MTKIAKQIGDNGRFLDRYVAQLAIFIVEYRKANALMAIGANSTVVKRRYIMNIPSIIKKIVSPSNHMLDARSTVSPAINGSNGKSSICSIIFVRLSSWLAARSSNGSARQQRDIFENCKNMSKAYLPLSENHVIASHTAIA